MKKNSSGRTSFLVAIVAFIIWGLVTAYLEISSDISAAIFLLVIFSITYLRQEKRIRNSKSQTIDYIKQELEIAKNKTTLNNANKYEI